MARSARPWSAVIAASALLVGCAPKHVTGGSIVGSWRDDSNLAPGAVCGYRFNDDGTWSYWFHGSSANVMEIGTYKVVGNELRQTRTAAILNSGRVANTPETEVEKLTWLSPDRIRLTEGKDSFTYRRHDED